VEEVSASAEEMTAQVEEVTTSAQALAGMAQALQAAVAQFGLEPVEAAPAQPALAASRVTPRSSQHAQLAVGVRPYSASHVGAN
jgi:hypothetical protein